MLLGIISCQASVGFTVVSNLLPGTTASSFISINNYIYNKCSLRVSVRRADARLGSAHARK